LIVAFKTIAIVLSYRGSHWTSVGWCF